MYLALSRVCVHVGAKDWRQRPTTLAKDKRATQQIIEDTIVNTLLHVPGYLCRVQEGEFKYMVRSGWVSW